MSSSGFGICLNSVTLFVNGIFQTGFLERAEG